jgi:hypothetical protein
VTALATPSGSQGVVMVSDHCRAADLLLGEGAVGFQDDES